MSRLPQVILVADWSGNAKRRAVCRVNVDQRSLSILNSEHDWSFTRLIDYATEVVEADNSRVLISIDAALGVPIEYWHRLIDCAGFENARGFLDLLRLTAEHQNFWTLIDKASNWNPDSPFFRVPKGKGGLTGVLKQAGSDLRREIDRQSGSKSPFIVSGIPGTVGSATRSLWQEIAAMLLPERRFRVWPFEGALNSLMEASEIVVAETYPGIAYTTVLADELPSQQILIAKTVAEARDRALIQLKTTRWIVENDVALPTSIENEDQFDALFAGLGHLRCFVEGLSLESPSHPNAIIEGGILLSPSVDRVAPARRF